MNGYKRGLGHIMKKKYRINTTISQKHHELLKKYALRFGTQQSVLEHALESLENNKYENREPSKDEELWRRLYSINNILALLMPDYTKILFETADFTQIEEYIKKQKPAEFGIEWYYNKPLKECSLQEIIDAAILNIKLLSTASSINYTDRGDYYTINVIHELGINVSKALVIINESAFKSYGVLVESNFSVRNVNFKIIKKEDG